MNTQAKTSVVVTRPQLNITLLAVDFADGTTFRFTVDRSGEYMGGAVKAGQPLKSPFSCAAEWFTVEAACKQRPNETHEARIERIAAQCQLCASMREFVTACGCANT